MELSTAALRAASASSTETRGTIPGVGVVSREASRGGSRVVSRGVDRGVGVDVDVADGVVVVAAVEGVVWVVVFGFVSVIVVAVERVVSVDGERWGCRGPLEAITVLDAVGGVVLDTATVAVSADLDEGGDDEVDDGGVIISQCGDNSAAGFGTATVSSPADVDGRDDGVPLSGVSRCRLDSLGWKWADPVAVDGVGAE